MPLFTILISGIAGTFVMTAFLYIISWITGKNTKVIKILGTMLTFQTQADGGLSDRFSAIAVGIVVHYIIGIGFAAVFHWLLSISIVVPSIGWGALFGLMAGIIGIIVWKITFYLHPLPPCTIPLPFYFMCLLVGHILFGVMLAFIVQLMNS